MKLSRRNTSRRSVRRVRSKASTLALLTDFGMVDHYVGTVKGVIRSMNPSVSIVDISHDVQPQRIRQAGYLLWAAYKFFPVGTIFLCVVDPGVGTSRRILAVRTAKYIFLAPDNMLLDFVLSEEKVVEAVDVKMKNSSYILSSVSQTFHGRDIFAPIAAYLANGVSLKEIGKSVTLHPAMSPFLDVDDNESRTAELLHIDRFGNLVTNIRAGISQAPSQRLKSLIINGKSIDRWTPNYAEAPERIPSLIVGSSGLVEIAVKSGSAQRMLNAKVGNTVTVLWK